MLPFNIWVQIIKTKWRQLICKHYRGDLERVYITKTEHSDCISGSYYFQCIKCGKIIEYVFEGE